MRDKIEEEIERLDELWSEHEAEAEYHHEAMEHIELKLVQLKLTLEESKDER